MTSGAHEPYRWAIVSGPDRDFIFFLTREQFRSQTTKDEKLAFAKNAGLPIEKLLYAQNSRRHPRTLTTLFYTSNLRANAKRFRRANSSVR